MGVARGKLFGGKANATLVNELIAKLQIEPQRAVILCDGYSQLESMVSDHGVKRIIDVRSASPDEIDALDDTDVLIYACSQDDLGMPFVARLHRQGRKYYPVWNPRPGGYAFANTVARETLEQEFRFQQEHGYGKWDFGYGDFVNLIQAVEMTRQPRGCYLEVGCYRGSSAGVVLRYLAARQYPMNAFFLDVFEGFTYPEARHSPDATWFGTHQTDGLPQVRQRLQSYAALCPALHIEVLRNNVITDRLPRAVVKQGIALANLDVDMHEAVYAGLNRLAPCMLRDGIIVVEDAGHTPLLIGARYALQQFLEGPQGGQFMHLVLESGQSFLIKR